MEDEHDEHEERAGDLVYMHHWRTSSSGEAEAVDDLAAELRRAAAEGEARGLERAADWLESDADCDDNLFTLARKVRALKAVPRG